MHRLKFVFPGFKAGGAPAPKQACKPVLKIFKFGSSVLRTPDDFVRVAGEIYRDSDVGIIGDKRRYGVRTRFKF